MEFTDILDEYGVEYHKGDSDTRPGWINFRCPICEKNPYMGYHLAGRYLNCWNCGRSGLIEVLMTITGLTFGKVQDLIKGLPKEDLPAYFQHRGKLNLPKCRDDIRLTEHATYLTERGFDVFELQKFWKIEAIGIFGGKLRWRILIPVFFRGEIVSWTTRALYDRQPRYWSAKDEESAIPIDDLLYGIDYCTHKAVLVEGPLDVWAIGPGAICGFGMRMSPAQMEQLSKLSFLGICFDKEEKAQERANKLARDLSIMIRRVEVFVLDSAKDPAELLKTNDPDLESLRERIRNF